MLIAIAEELLLALARVGEKRVGRDSVQPSRELRFLPKGLDVPVSKHESFLCEIVGERVVSRGQPA